MIPYSLPKLCSSLKKFRRFTFHGNRNESGRIRNQHFRTTKYLAYGMHTINEVIIVIIINSYIFYYANSMYLKSIYFTISTGKKKNLSNFNNLS